MLTVVIEGDELYDEEKNEFSNLPSITLEFEHSLVSLSKWEAIYQKPFLGKGEKTKEEIFGYLKEMVLTPNVPDEVFFRLSEENLKLINEYIESKQSATTFGNLPKERGSGEIITSELIYYWMITLNIPFECETWHLNRLFSLIRVCGIKNSPPKKMSKNEIAARNRSLNAKRRAQLGSSG